MAKTFWSGNRISCSKAPFPLTGNVLSCLVPGKIEYAKCACQSCGGHLEYPVAMGGATIDCPHCHFATTLPPGPPREAPRPAAGGRQGVLLKTVALLVIIGGLGYAARRFHFAGSEAPASAHLVKPDVAPSTNRIALAPSSNALVTAPPKPSIPTWRGLTEVGPVKLEKTGEGSLVYAVGALRNTTQEQKFGVQATVDLFDARGDKLGAATDYADTIQPGKEWRFRALVVQSGAVRAKLASVTEN